MVVKWDLNSRKRQWRFEAKSKQEAADPSLQYLYAEALSESAATSEEASVKAIAAARRALALEPSYQPAHGLLCLLLQRAGDLEGVIEQANEATKVDPYDESALYQEMLAERKLKHAQQAQELAQRLREAKAHNQFAGTKYRLQESNKGASTPTTGESTQP